MSDPGSSSAEHDIPGTSFLRVDSDEEPPNLLTDLPIEVLLSILEYLDPIFLHTVVSCVCKKLNGIIHCDYLWKRFFHTNNSLVANNIYPYLNSMGLYSQKWKSGRDTTWRDLTVSLQSAKLRWFGGRRVVTIPYEEASINVVHMMKNGWCMTGSRDRSIKVWDVTEKRMPRYIHNAHKGWLSGLCTFGHDSVVSCGWDSHVKIWKFSDNMEPLNSFCVDMAVMDVDCKPQMIAACTFPKLILIDPRIGRPDGISRFVIEGGSVIQLSFWENSVLMTSRSKNLLQFDLRMNRTCVRESILTESTPRIMSILDDIVYVGDNAGNVYLYDLTDNFRLIETFAMCESKAQIRALIPRTGYMIVGSSDGELKAVLSVKGPNGIQVLKSMTLAGEVSCGHFFDNTLAILDGTSRKMTIFTPFL